MHIYNKTFRWKVKNADEYVLFVIVEYKILRLLINFLLLSPAILAWQNHSLRDSHLL